MTTSIQPLFTAEKVRQMLQYSPGMSQGVLAGRPPLTPQRPSFLEKEENCLLFRMMQEERFQTQMAHEEFLGGIQKMRDGNYCLRMERQDGRRFHTLAESSNPEELDGAGLKSPRGLQELVPAQVPLAPRQGLFKEDGHGLACARTCRSRVRTRMLVSHAHAH